MKFHDSTYYIQRNKVKLLRKEEQMHHLNFVNVVILDNIEIFTGNI